MELLQKKNKATFSVVLLTLVIGLVFSACKKREVLTIGGSETMHGMADFLGNAFEKENSSISVEVMGGGSQVGIDLMSKGKLDMALSSRDLSEDEFAKLNRDNNLEKLTIAYDGIALVVHPSNPVNQMTAKQVSDVFSGAIVDWSELGGKKEKISLVVRNDKSGTLNYFTTFALQQRILGLKEYEKNRDRVFGKSAQIVRDNDEMANLIEKDPNAIGFMGMGSAFVENPEKLKVLEFAKTSEDEYVKPTPKNVFDRKYKLSRGLYLLYRADTKEKIEAFTSFLTGEKGQELIQKRGYLRASLPEVEVKAE